MNAYASLADITFTKNGYIDVAQLNALYRLIGWDSHHRRTEAETTQMLRVSHYYIAAHTAEGTLVGFASASMLPRDGSERQKQFAMMRTARENLHLTKALATRTCVPSTCTLSHG